jgi:hypothetical protein
MWRLGMGMAMRFQRTSIGIAAATAREGFRPAPNPGGLTSATSTFEEVRMRKATLLLVPLFLFACDREPVAPEITSGPDLSATSEWSESSTFIDYYQRFPGLLATCVGEELHLTGTITITHHYVTRPNGEVLDNWGLEAHDDWQMVGETTGEVWRVQTPGFDVGVNRPGSYVQKERFVFENQTTGVVLDSPFLVVYVTNAAGEVKVDKMLADKCTLRHG